MRILLIEDDKALCRVLQPTLQAAGFASDCCHNGADGLALIKTGYYDACILDRMLPGLDGLLLLQSARADGVRIPVLMLTALGQVGDRVAGLDAGADDYLAKPFDTRELLARLRALVRRPTDLNEAAHRINCGDLILDTAQHTLTGPAGTVTLSRRECDLLAVFCRAPGMMRARSVLLGSVWGADAEVEEASLDSYISFARRRLHAVGSRAVIRTLRGTGYRLELNNET
ncbi:response regulator transcription factor [uncultured Gemmiger sp.]|uniref:response regulator transcription factor n=1 Tax=uncultured Gemmiger sp. TaxID=1623490 RepID=UPI0025D4EC54|nr:response regulator transcription factor [uncultured Gemmiger sp.]